MGSLLTVDEYKRAPGSVSAASLVTDGQYADQNAALADQIERATRWAENTICGQPLIAAQRTKFRTKPVVGAVIALDPDAWLVPLTLNEVWFGTTNFDIQQVTDLTPTWVEDSVFMVPLQVGRSYLVKFVYTSGWPCTTLAADVAAAATTFTVADPTGITAGSTLTIADGPVGEYVTVESLAGSVLTIGALTNDHAAGVGVHNVPGDVKQAAVLATTGFIQSKGTGAIVMNQLQAPSQPVGEASGMTSALARAAVILKTYRTL